MIVLVVEDRALVREGLRVLVESMGVFERCEVAGSIAEAASRLGSVAPGVDLVLLDLGLPDAQGPEAIDGILAKAPTCRILVCSGSDDPRYIHDSFARGAHGYLTKNASPEALQAAIRSVLRGERHVPPEILGTSPSSSPAPATSGAQGLTPRQCDVLRTLAQGHSNKDIAQKLDMSPATVRAHLSSIFRVLGVENRTQAATHPQALALLKR